NAAAPTNGTERAPTATSFNSLAAAISQSSTTSFGRSALQSTPGLSEVLAETSSTYTSAVFGTGLPVPTDAVPVNVTGPGANTAPSAGVSMVASMLVPPGREPLAASAGAADPGG